MLTTILASAILLQHDKVYAVLAVLLIIFGALIVYAWTMQRKIAQLEARFEALDPVEKRSSTN